jgi:hypothetical protein
LAETGDPTRIASARAVVKHSGLAPREKSGGTFTGRTKLTGQGRPGLRTWLLGTRDIASALAAYDERLTMMGYQVTRAKTSLTATRDGFEFTATAGTPFTDVVGPGSTPTVVPPEDAGPAQDDHFMTVTLRDTR